MNRKALAVAAIVSAEVVGVAYKRGTIFQVDTVVGCRGGHLFTTWWIPGASVKALRLGWWRFQWCPVGRHWSFVTPVRESDLSDDELQVAHAVHDLRIP